MSHVFPNPPHDPLSAPHWEGAKQGRLLLQQCQACGQCRFPATRSCPHCLSQDSDWVEGSGGGTVESFCTFHKAYWPQSKAALPYVVVQVRLDEGVQLMSNMMHLDGTTLRIGMRVRVCFDPVNPDLTLVKFRPDSTAPPPH